MAELAAALGSDPETGSTRAGDAATARRTSKRATAFRTIGEVAEDLDLPAHVLRFWESKFPQLKPLKRGGGRRYYRPEDIVLLRHIRQCLYQDGYTIRGAQKLLREGRLHSGRSALDLAPSGDADAAPSLFPLEAVARPAPEPALRKKPVRRSSTLQAALEELRRDLLEARTLLDDLQRSRERS